MKILKLDVSNFKRIKSVHIEPDGSIVEITGQNGNGKSSTLDAICAAIGGASLIPEQPVRDGERRASILVEIGDDEHVELVVERTWKDGKSALTVRSPEGASMPKAQGVLNDLIGTLSFDPLAFTRMKPAEQVATLKAVTGLDFSDLDAKEKSLAEQRTIVGREKKSLEGQLDGLPQVPANTPDEEISVASVQAKYEQAIEQRDANQRKRQELDNVCGVIERYDESIADIEREIARLQEQLAESRKSRESAQLQYAAISEEVDALVEPNLEEIKAEMESLDDRNRAVRQKNQRKAVYEAHRAKEAEHDDLQDAIAQVRIDREQRLAEASMPVDGLVFDESGVSYNGIAFANASQAEQIRISTAIGAALNPKLKVMLIRDGSLLDTNSRRLLAELAEEHGLQVWLEVVGTGENGGILIEDGCVVANPHRETVPA